MNPLKDIENIKSFLAPAWLKALFVAAVLAFITYEIYAYGVDVERGRWQLKESKALTAANQKILDLQNQKYDLEQMRLKDAADLTLKFNKELKQNEQNANAVIADLRAGTRKLRIATVRPAGGDCATSQASAAEPATETETASELTAGAAAALVRFAAKKDEVIILHNACIDQLAADRGEKALEPDL